MKELMKIMNGCLTFSGFAIVVAIAIMDNFTKDMLIQALVAWVYILINFIVLVLPNKGE